MRLRSQRIAFRRPYDNGGKLTGYDAVIPRIRASITLYGLAVLGQLETLFDENEII